MAKSSELQVFYASQAWQAFRMRLIAERGTCCQHCGGLIAKASDITLHHIQELTLENYKDTCLSLNPDNILIIHKECHNKLHRRYKDPNSYERHVYLVYGPPLAGKGTFVLDRMERGDLVVDMDQLYRALSLLDLYDKPDSLLPNVRGVRNVLLDQIKTRYGRWTNAWIIGGFAEKYRREKTAADIGAELIFCDVREEECLRRLETDPARQERQEEWTGYIRKWFAEYRP